MANETKKVITLICERAVDVNGIMDSSGHCKDIDHMSIVKLPCSGMIQPLMIEGAIKAGAAGVIVTGCQIGDCYYREGNRHIRERLLGERMPGLKKTVDRRRVLALWLSRPQTARFIAEAKEFVGFVRDLPADAPKAAAPSPAAKAAAVTGPGPNASPDKESRTPPPAATDVPPPAAPPVATEADKPDLTVVKPKDDSPEVKASAEAMGEVVAEKKDEEKKDEEKKGE